MPLSLNLLMYSLRIKEPKIRPHFTFHSCHTVCSHGRDRLGGGGALQKPRACRKNLLLTSLDLVRLIRVIVLLLVSWLKEEDKRDGGGRKDRKKKAKEKKHTHTHTKHTRDVQSQTGMII